MIGTKRRLALAMYAIGAGSVPACGTSTGEGTLRVTVYGEDYVEDEIPAEDLVDGWTIDLSKFVVVLDEVAADGVELQRRQAFDLTLPSGGEGHEVGFVVVSSGTVEQLDYRIGPGANATGGNAAAGDIEASNRDGWSLLVEGTATRGDQSIAFSWAFETDTRYGECATGRVVSDGGEATSQITIHADHLFYDDLDSPEPNVAFDLIASADVDGDSMVTPQELRGVEITGLQRYQVGGRDITELWSFIEAQTRTLGHVDGEGHCQTDAE